MAALVALALAAACAPLSTAGQGPETISAEEAGLDVPAALAERGVRRFLFTGWDGPDFPVWSFRPDSAGANAPVLFVHHGVRRDADRYIAEWLDLAQAMEHRWGRPRFVHLAERGILGPNTTFVHMNLIRDEEVDAILSSGMVMVWCPLAYMTRGTPLHRPTPRRSRHSTGLRTWSGR